MNAAAFVEVLISMHWSRSGISEDQFIDCIFSREAYTEIRKQHQDEVLDMRKKKLISWEKQDAVSVFFEPSDRYF